MGREIEVPKELAKIAWGLIAGMLALLVMISPRPFGTVIGAIAPWLAWAVVKLLPLEGLGDREEYFFVIGLSLLGLESFIMLTSSGLYSYPYGGTDEYIAAYLLSLCLFILTKKAFWTNDSVQQK